MPPALRQRPIAIHLNWKEAAVRTGDIDALAKLADLLVDSDISVPIVYFEFQSANDMKFFCKAVKMIPFIRDISDLEKEKARVEKEKDALNDEILKLTNERGKLVSEIDRLEERRGAKKKA